MSDNTLPLNIPVNSTSLGNVSVCILTEIVSRGIAPLIFPIGGIDASSYEIPKNIGEKIQQGLQIAPSFHDRNNPAVKLWHINDAITSVSKDQYLITFHETDQLTPTEVNVLNNQKAVFVTSSFSKRVFKQHGIKNVYYLPLGFDHSSFRPTYKDYYDDGRISWHMGGKVEHRKRHKKAIRAWFNEFGNNPNHILHLAIHNSFLKKEQMNKFYDEITQGGYYWNVNILPYTKTNREYNEVLNSCDIGIALSGGESRDLIAYHLAGLGKHLVALNAHAYQDYLNNDNAVLVEPNGKITADDGIFFKEGSQYSQGQFFDFDEDDARKAYRQAVERFKEEPINRNGLELQKLTYKDTVDKLLEVIYGN